MNILPVEAEYFNADRTTAGQTDRHKEADFRNFAKAPES
jgi:hypothetical protein